MGVRAPAGGWAPNFSIWAPGIWTWAPKHPAKIGKGVSDHAVTFGRPTRNAGRPASFAGRPASTHGRRFQALRPREGARLGDGWGKRAPSLGHAVGAGDREQVAGTSLRQPEREHGAAEVSRRRGRRKRKALSEPRRTVEDVLRTSGGRPQERTRLSNEPCRGAGGVPGGRKSRAPGRRTGEQGDAAQPTIAEVAERPRQPAARPRQCGSSIFRALGRTGMETFRAKSTPGGVAERPRAPASPRADTRVERGAPNGRLDLPERAGDGAFLRRRPLPRPVPLRNWAPRFSSWAPSVWTWAPKHPAKIGKIVSDHAVTFGRPIFRAGRPLGARA